MEATLNILGLLLALAAVLPWIRQGDWWIRVFDFPRLQLAAGGIGVLLGYRFVTPSPWTYGVQLLVVLATLYQLNRIRPFTRFGPKQVQSAGASDPDASRLRVMIVNVWMPNRRADGLISLVHRYEPDILLAVETDVWWASELKSLEQTYPYTVCHPLPNTYGMLLLSRYPLVRPEVRFLIEDGVPSIATGVQLPDGTRLRFQALHPRPPRPTKRQDSTNRDAELVIVGDQLAEEKGPTIVAGDLNDVAWSYTTDLFQRISGLLDPRRGRGMYNSFNARIPLLRFPLDHIFHSEHFRVVRLERLEKFGSDHFPLFIELSFQCNAARTQNTPEADVEDHKLARELRDRPGSTVDRNTR
jgi:endonuclease/exonuclease/phosphatase (EEP) superfamily protein YafD